MLASKNAIARLTTTRTNTIGYIMVCMYVSLAHTQRETSALTEYLPTISILYIFSLNKFPNKHQPSFPNKFDAKLSNINLLRKIKETKIKNERLRRNRNGDKMSALLRTGLKVSLLQNAALH